MTTESSGMRVVPAFGRRDPDVRGYFGRFGGRFVPETLVAPVEALEAAYRDARQDEAFVAEFERLLRDYVGRPTPLSEARRLQTGGARIFLKREDLTHTGAHKINNAIGQALLAARMGKRRVIAETGAGQHGVATATACALLGLECEVYMGAEDMARQAPNVARMELLGARVRRVDAGARTLKDAINEAMRDWVSRVDDHLLPAWVRAGAAPVPAHGARVPIGDRPRSARAGPRAGRPSAVCRRGLRGRRQQRDGHLRRVPGRCERAADRSRGGRCRPHARPARRPLCTRQRGRAARHPDIRAAGREWQHRGHAFGVRRDGLRGGRPGTRLAAGAGEDRVPAWRATPKRCTRSPNWLASRGSCPRWSRRTPWRRRCRWPANSGPRPSS